MNLDLTGAEGGKIGMAFGTACAGIFVTGITA